MSRDAEDDDHTTFLSFDGEDGSPGPALSRAAYMLHTSGIVNSIHDGHPGFVSDDYLNAITAETTVTAAELCAAGMWRRVDDGYVVLDRETLQMALDADERVQRMIEDRDDE